MIVKVRGKIDLISAGYLVVDAGPLSYKVFAPTGVLKGESIGNNIVLWTHQVVREDDVSLYGFPTFDDLKMFELLLLVSGVGPKMALGVLSTATAKEIEAAILADRIDLFTRVSGIGKKNASRIVIDLKGKIASGADVDLAQLGAGKETGDLVQALKELDYKHSEIREALGKVDSGLALEDQVKQALKMLAK